MKVSVVIPTYNRASIVGNAIRSALAQTHRDLEVIVMDDGSTDETPLRVRDIADERVCYFHQPNGGVSAARNHGVALAQGEVIAFLDSDDIWKPQKLESEVRFLTAHPEADAIFSDLEKHDGADVVPSFMRASPVFASMLARASYPASMVIPQRDMLLCLLQEVPILPSAFAIRRDAFIATGWFDKSWRSWEDWEFFLRFARSRRFGYIDRALTTLRISKDSLHRIDAAAGRARMLEFLTAQRKYHQDDREALAAIRDGLIMLCRHMVWEHSAAGRRREAIAVCRRALRETQRVEFALRMLHVLVRPRVRAVVTAPPPLAATRVAS